MAKKNKNENITINKDPLMPTTIGTINEKENSPLGVIILFGLLIVMVFFLPTINNYIEKLKGNTVEEPLSATPKNNTPNNNNETPPATTSELEYLDLSNDIEIAKDGVRYNIHLDNIGKILNVTITNLSSGSNTLFINSKYYLELYSADKQLLQRIKVDGKEVVSSIVYEYDLTESYKLGNPSYLVIENKNEKDYPAITLQSLDSNNMPFLTCTKNDETLVYTFEQKNNSYLLRKIKDSTVVSGNDQDTVTRYEALKNSYESIDGVEAEISISTRGFTFNIDIDLTRVTIAEKKRILNNLAYYERNTLAKVVAFELNASGYTCK